MRIERWWAFSAWGRLILAAALVSVVSSASAQTASAAARDEGQEHAAQWLTRIQDAAERQNYEGVFVYSHGSLVQSSRIVHFVVRDDEYEKLESLDGRPRTVLRHNDDLYTLLPDRKVCVVEKRQNTDAFPALLSGNSEQALARYEARRVGVDRVAGLASQVIQLDPKDDLRFVHKLWVDQRTGLLLRAQTLDEQGQVLEQIAFSQLRIGIPVNQAAIVNGIREATNWQVVRPPLMVVDIATTGWRLAPVIAGFHRIRELRRPMAALDPQAAPIPVDQAVYSDGLATVSIFIEPVAGNMRTAGSAVTGATHVLVRRRGDFWVTALGEVPFTTLDRFIATLAVEPSK